MKTRAFSFLAAVLLLWFLLVASLPSEAVSTFYTIQAGTYVASLPEYAERHFDSLSKKLNEDERHYLRIEEKGKFLVVRVGKLSDPVAAERLLNKVKDLVPDAFLVKTDNFEGQVKKMYSAPSPSKGKGSTVHGDTRKPIMEDYWTVQIGSFLKPEQARSKLDALAGRLSKSDLDSLRIEKMGKEVSLRIGKFKTENEALDFLAGVHDIIPDAIILKSSSPMGKVFGVEEDPEPKVYTIRGKRGESGEEVRESAGKKEIDSFLKDVSEQYDTGQYGNAVELLRKGIAQWPDNPTLHAWYGAALLNMQHPENALQQYRKAVELSPDVPEYHAGVGVSLIYVYMENAKESIEAFKKAIEIDPKNVSALEGLGFVYASIGRKDLATELYDRLASVDKEASARLYQAITGGVDWGR